MIPASCTRTWLLLPLLLLVLSGSYAPIEAATEFYVDSHNSRQGDGSAQNPFQSIHRAVEKVREVNNGTDDIIVYLRGGYHFLDSTLVFREADGGKNNHTITYTAYPGEIPVISGAIPVTGWQPVQGTSPQQWKAPCAITNKVRSAWIFNRPAFMACGPTIEATGAWGDFNGKSDGFHFTPSVGAFTNPRDAEVLRVSSWTVHQICIEDLHPSETQGVLKMQQPIWYIAQALTGGGGPASKPSGHRYLLRNAYEFLDSPGEFYFDRTNHTMYYIPRENEVMEADAVLFAPRIEVLVTLLGSSPTSKVSHITFTGISFHHDSYLLPQVGESRGYMTLQGPEAVVTPPLSKNSDNGFLIQGACEMMFADNIRIERCRFEHCGATGISLINGVSSCTLEGNIFRDLGAGAVIIGHMDHMDLSNIRTDIPLPFLDGGEELCKDVRFANNLIREVSLDLAHAPPITLFSTQGIDVSHNDIGTAGYTAISFGWGWSSSITSQGNNRIHANRTNAPVQYFNDGGHIYSLSPNPGTVVDSNVAFDTGMSVVPWYLQAQKKTPHAVFCPGHGGLYPDEATAGVTFRGNVYEGLCNQWGSWCCEKENTFAGNWAMSGRSGLEEKGAENNTYPSGQRPPDVEMIINRSGLETPYTDLYDALFWNPGDDVGVAQNHTGIALPAATIQTSVFYEPRPGVAFTLPFSQGVTIDILDVQGRLLRNVTNSSLRSGVHRVHIPVTMNRGFFLFRFRTTDFSRVVSLPLVR